MYIVKTCRMISFASDPVCRSAFGSGSRQTHPIGGHSAPLSSAVEVAMLVGFEDHRLLSKNFEILGLREQKSISLLERHSVSINISTSL